MNQLTLEGTLLHRPELRDSNDTGACLNLWIKTHQPLRLCGGRLVQRRSRLRVAAFDPLATTLEHLRRGWKVRVTGYVRPCWPANPQCTDALLFATSVTRIPTTDPGEKDPTVNEILLEGTVLTSPRVSDHGDAGATGSFWLEVRRRFTDGDGVDWKRARLHIIDHDSLALSLRSRGLEVGTTVAIRGYVRPSYPKAPRSADSLLVATSIEPTSRGL